MFIILLFIIINSNLKYDKCIDKGSFKSNCLNDQYNSTQKDELKRIIEAVKHLKNEIELTCNAQNLPEFIEIDMKDLEIGSNIMQSQIILPEGVSLSTNILNNQDQPVASVNVTRAALDIDDDPSEGEQDESEESTDETSETKDAADESSSEEESKD